MHFKEVMLKLLLSLNMKYVTLANYDQRSISAYHPGIKTNPFIYNYHSFSQMARDRKFVIMLLII